jgi:hypothetical protein
MSFEIIADPIVVETNITKQTNPLIEAIESIQQHEVVKFDEIWKSLVFEDQSEIEYSNSHLRPTGRVLNEGTPWASYEHVEYNSAGTIQPHNSEQPPVSNDINKNTNVSTTTENFSHNCLTGITTQKNNSRNRRMFSTKRMSLSRRWSQ